MKKVELWGSFPNPVGGVSIHIFRLLVSLSNIFNMEGVNFSKSTLLYGANNIRKAGSFIKEVYRITFIDKQNLVHLHSNNVIAVFILSTLINRRLIITLHNKRLLAFPVLKKLIYILSLKYCKAILINDIEVYEFLVSKNVNVFQVPAYIPPLEVEDMNVPQSFSDFRNLHSIIVSMSIWNFDYSSNDIYGTQYIIPLLKIFKSFNVGFCLCISNVFDEASLITFKDELNKEGLNGNVLFLINEVSNGSMIWRNSDIFFRPTSTDSESISVKEALIFDIPVIASNVCNRPKEVVVYQTANFEDMKMKVELMLNNLFLEQAKLINRTNEQRFRETGVPFIRKIYSHILNEINITNETNNTRP